MSRKSFAITLLFVAGLIWSLSATLPTFAGGGRKTIQKASGSYKSGISSGCKRMGWGKGCTSSLNKKAKGLKGGAESCYSPKGKSGKVCVKGVGKKGKKAKKWEVYTVGQSAAERKKQAQKKEAAQKKKKSAQEKKTAENQSKKQEQKAQKAEEREQQKEEKAKRRAERKAQKAERLKNKKKGKKGGKKGNKKGNKKGKKKGKGKNGAAGDSSGAESMTYCWQDTDKNWLCDGPERETTEPSAEIESSRVFSGCPRPRLEFPFESEKGAGIVYLCEKHLDGGPSGQKTENRDISKWHDFPEDVLGKRRKAKSEPLDEATPETPQ